MNPVKKQDVESDYSTGLQQYTNVPQMKRKEIDHDDDDDDESFKKHKWNETLTVEKEGDHQDRPSTWKSLCRTISDKTEEEQSAVRDDILGYFRLWNYPDSETFLERWISHPNESVRMDIFTELSTYIERFCFYIDEQADRATSIAAKIIDYEKKHGCTFATMEEGTGHLERLGIIDAQKNVIGVYNNNDE